MQDSVQVEDSVQVKESGLSAFPEDAELVITSVQVLKRPKHRYRIFSERTRLRFMRMS